MAGWQAELRAQSSEAIGVAPCAEIAEHHPARLEPEHLQASFVNMTLRFWLLVRAQSIGACVFGEEGSTVLSFIHSAS